MSGGRVFCSVVLFLWSGVVVFVCLGFYEVGDVLGWGWGSVGLGFRGCFYVLF